MKKMKKMKRTFAVLLALCLALSMTACAGKTPAAEQTPAAAEKPAQETAKPVLLVVSFGTSYNESRDATIGAVEQALAAAYPAYEVRRAFTSQIIIDILKEREGLAIDNVEQALDRLAADGVKELVVQPTHIMSGYEYDDLMAALDDYKDKFESVKVGAPLLTSEEDYDAVVKTLAEETAEYNVEGTAIAFMGHGTEHEANAAYAKLQQKFRDAGYANYYVGTVEGKPLVEDVLEQIRATDTERVVLLPLMVVAGDHATNDMAGDEEGSWKDVFTKAGYEVECVLKGLGQYAGAQELYVAHAGDAMNG